MIGAVLFDLDETLLDRTTSLRVFLADQYERFRMRLGAKAIAPWLETFLALDARGHVPKSIVYPALLAEFDGDAGAADDLIADYVSRCSLHALAVEGTQSTLAELRRRGFKLGIVTNGETVFQTRHIEALGLRDLVDAVLISQTEGLRKPEKALFHRAANALGVSPQHCMFVGDNPTVDVLGAKAAGMKTTWFRSGQEWPATAGAGPDHAIDRLEEILAIVGACQASS